MPVPRLPDGSGFLGGVINRHDARPNRQARRFPPYLALNNPKFGNRRNVAVQKRIWLLTLVAVVLLSGSAAWAEDNFYVIGGGGGAVGTKITSLPYPITTPGFYYLGGNLSLSGTGNAITVYVDNVTINLMGCSLTFTGAGSEGSGIAIMGHKNVEIRNGTISGFSVGIYEVGIAGANHRVSNIRADYNTTGEAVGIQLFGKNHLVRGCTASNNGNNGIVVDSGTITGCVACNNAKNGIFLRGSGSLLDNIATNTSSTGTIGFAIASVANIVMDGNSAAGNGTNYSAGGAGTVWGVNAGH
jgi:hypothetical protein